MAAPEQVLHEHDATQEVGVAVPQAAHIGVANPQTGVSGIGIHCLTELNGQIHAHHQQQAHRSCLDNLIGVVYHADEESLAALERLRADIDIIKKLPHAGIIEKSAGASAKMQSQVAEQIQHDREVLNTRSEINHGFGAIAETVSLLVKGRAGLALTLSTYALEEMKPGIRASDQAFQFCLGALEGGVVRGTSHLTGKATQHAAVAATRFLKNEVRPQLDVAGKLIFPNLFPKIAESLRAVIDLHPNEIPHLLKPITSIHTSELSELAPRLQPIDLAHDIVYRPPATPQEAFNVVSGLLRDRAPALESGPLVIAEHNAQYGNDAKALLYLPSYQFMFSRAHLTFLEEIDPDFCRVIGKNLNYDWLASRVNSRGQGVGFLVHPRLEVIGKPTTFEQVAHVDGIRDLRPAFAAHFKDKVSGAQFDAIAVHLKSMRGGPITKNVRCAQTEDLARLASSNPTILGGDWNFFLDHRLKEMAPLRIAGFRLIDPANSDSTQEFGGRLDGFMTRNIPWALGNCQTYNFWHYLPDSSFSDHGMLFTEVDVR